jgi:ubiquinone/menaquinone biosynthesis C-methylase UbiE
MNELQKKNLDWWNTNPMAYDWRKDSPYEEGSEAWFGEVDRRFFSESASFFAQEKGGKPFSRLIPYNALKGKDVLEIGCGSGAHAQLLAASECQLQVIDLTPKAVELTKRRFGLQGSKALVLQMDGEKLAFRDGSFDFIWSWGVIHHSANPESIISEMARVLRQGGQTRVMVYHKNSIAVLANILRGFITGKFFTGLSIHEVLNCYADGAIARFYSKKQLSGMFFRYFDEVRVYVYGQKNEIYPIPGTGLSGVIKRHMTDMTSNAMAEKILNRVGTFLFIVAYKR